MIDLLAYLKCEKKRFQKSVDCFHYHWLDKIRFQGQIKRFDSTTSKLF